MFFKLTLSALAVAVLAAAFAPAPLVAQSAQGGAAAAQTVASTSAAAQDDSPGLVDQLMEFFFGVFDSRDQGSSAASQTLPSEPSDRGPSFDPDGSTNR